MQIGRRKKKNRDEETVPANVGKGQFHSMNQSADRKERRKKEKKNTDEVTVSENVGKGQFHSVNQSADRKERRRKEKQR